jgi:hypothetical protein
MYRNIDKASIPNPPLKLRAGLCIVAGSITAAASNSMPLKQTVGLGDAIVSRFHYAVPVMKFDPATGFCAATGFVRQVSNRQVSALILILAFATVKIQV